LRKKPLNDESKVARAVHFVRRSSCEMITTLP
jgi:hypothetical protein